MLGTRSNTFEENLIGKLKQEKALHDYLIYDLPKGINDLLNGG